MTLFAHPSALFLILPLSLAGWWRLRALLRASIPFGPISTEPTNRPAEILLQSQWSLEMLLLCLVVLALAGPGRTDSVETFSERGLDIALVLDISASMQAADFEPNRLEALKEITREFVLRAGGNRIAVHAFAGTAFTQSPLATDHRTTLALIDGLNYESIDHSESGGTAIGDALLAAADALESARIDGRDQVMILISDGESNLGVDPLLAARYIRDRKIRLHVIGIGGFDEVEVSVHGKPFINSDDEILTTRLDDAQLRAVAEAAGGDYRRADTGDVLGQIFNDLARLERTPLEIETITTRSSWGPGLALAAFGIFALTAVLRNRLRRPWR